MVWKKIYSPFFKKKIFLQQGSKFIFIDFWKALAIRVNDFSMLFTRIFYLDTCMYSGIIWFNTEVWSSNAIWCRGLRVLTTYFMIPPTAGCWLGALVKGQFTNYVISKLTYMVLQMMLYTYNECQNHYIMILFKVKSLRNNS